MGGAPAPARSEVDACAFALSFATIRLNQFRCGSRRKADVWPAFCGITRLEWRANDTGCDEFVELSRRLCRLRAWRHEFGDDSAMSRDRNTLAALNASDIPAQVVLQFMDAC